MEERVAEAYRREGPAIFAACRRLLGDDQVAAAATARAFVRLQRRPRERDAIIRATCQELRSLLPVPAAPATEEELAEARAKFELEVYQRTLPYVLRDQAPPPILRWVFIYLPIVVCLAAVGMFLAVKNAKNPERFGGGKRAAHMDVFLGDDELETGSRVHVGDTLRIEIHPMGNRFATVRANARVLYHDGPFEEDQGPIALPPLVVGDEGHLRLSAEFGASPKGIALKEVGVVLDIE